MKLFAAICIGSYELELKIFEVKKNGQKELCCVRQRLELGRDVFRNRMISRPVIKRLCGILLRFRDTIAEYQVDFVRICATTAVREANNLPVVLEQIRLQTGFEAEVLSNSEQRFLGYKAIALHETEFAVLAAKGLAVIEAGSGSLQISLFHKGRLLVTQNIPLGAYRLKERLDRTDYINEQLEKFIKELAEYHLGEFKRHYLKEQTIEHVIIFGEGARAFLTADKNDKNTMQRDKFLKQCQKFCELSEEDAEERLGGAEDVQMLMASAIIFSSFVTLTGVSEVWIPGIVLNDGLCYEYLQKHVQLVLKHDFEADILTSAFNMAERFQWDSNHCRFVMETVLLLFDEVKKKHGLSQRDRLLLQLSAILHECGKYISLTKSAECTYQILMASELIGLSHLERSIVAWVIRLSDSNFEVLFPTGRELSGFEGVYSEESGKVSGKGSSPIVQDYLRIRKLAALLNVADSLDMTHTQKFTELRVKQEKDQLKLTVLTKKDFRLEKSLFHEAAKPFEDIYQTELLILWKVKTAE